MSAPGAEFFFVLRAVLSSLIEKFELYALSLSSFIICSNAMSMYGSFSVFISVNPLEYNCYYLFLCIHLSVSPFFCLLLAPSVFVGLNGLPLIFLIIFHMVLPSVLWLSIEIKSSISLF